MITAHDAIRTLREVVVGNESTVYASPDQLRCVYVHEGKPSCLIGCALDLLDWPIARLATLDAGSGIPACQLAWHFPDLIDKEACRIFERAQTMQDRRHTWGEVLAVAEDIYRDIITGLVKVPA